MNRKMLEQGQFNLSVVKNDLRPELDLSANYRVNGSGASYSDDIDNMTGTGSVWLVGGIEFQISHREPRCGITVSEAGIVD